MERLPMSGSLDDYLPLLSPALVYPARAPRYVHALPDLRPRPVAWAKLQALLSPALCVVNIPDNLIFPLTHRPLRDPVIASDNHTSEEREGDSVDEKIWFATSHCFEELRTILEKKIKDFKPAAIQAKL